MRPDDPAQAGSSAHTSVVVEGMVGLPTCFRSRISGKSSWRVNIFARCKGLRLHPIPGRPRLEWDSHASGGDDEW